MRAPAGLRSDQLIEDRVPDIDAELGEQEIFFGKDEGDLDDAAQDGVADGAATGNSPDGEGSATESDTPPNRWDAMKNALGKMGEGKQVRLPGEPGTDDEDTKDEDTGEEKSDEQRAEKPDAAQDKSDAGKEGKDGKGKPQGQERPADSAGRQVFTITDADGDEAELEWPEGATISFTADGQQVTAKTIGELVTFAQKGVHADRRLSQLGQERSRFETRASQLEQQVQAKDTEVRTAEEMILRAVFDDEARAALQKELEGFRDPKVREQVRKGEAAQQELEQRKQQDQERSSESNAQLAARFHQKVTSEVTDELAATDDDGEPKYRYLTPEDEPMIRQRFIDTYNEILRDTTEQYRRQAPSVGLSEAHADAEARKFALTYLTEDNLRQVVADVEEHYRQRAERASGTEPAGSAPKAKAPTDRAAAADAERHNNHVKAKIEQRNKTPRPLRGGADPAAGRREPSTEGMTFAQRMDLMRKTLREA